MCPFAKVPKDVTHSSNCSMTDLGDKKYGTWRASYVTAVSGVPVGCLNENGNLVEDVGDNCAIFTVGEYGDSLTTKKNDYLCGYADYFKCIGDDYPGLT